MVGKRKAFDCEPLLARALASATPSTEATLHSFIIGSSDHQTYDIAVLFHVELAVFILVQLLKELLQNAFINVPLWSTNEPF